MTLFPLLSYLPLFLFCPKYADYICAQSINPVRSEHLRYSQFCVFPRVIVKSLFSVLQVGFEART